MTNEILGDQVGVSVLVVGVLQWLKRQTWFPWITEHTDGLNRAVALAAAFLTSAGFQFAIDGGWQTGGTLTITIPSLTVIFSFLLHAAAQGGIQETLYRVAVKPKPMEVTGIVTEIKGLSTLTASRDQGIK